MSSKQMTSGQKVNELEFLLYAVEAIVGQMESYCNGTIGKPCNELHGLQIAAAQLVDRGLAITGAH